MSKLSAKAAATAALLGEPVSAAASEAPKKKRVKKEDGAGLTGLASAVPLDKQLVKLLGAAPKGMGQDEVCAALNVGPSDLLDPINELLGRHRIELLTDGSQKIFYKLVSAEKVEKLRGLNASEVVIYQHIEKSGNLGIWIKDLRRKSNLSAIEIPKILKELLKRKLIKCEKSIQATNKKVYMLYDVEPAREVSGGAWYDKSTGEFDGEYMKALEDAMMMFLTKKADKRVAERERVQRGQLDVTSAVETGSASAGEVEAFLSSTGAFKTVPSEDEAAKILEGLVFEGRLEKAEDEAADWLKAEAQASKIRASTSSAVDPTKKRRREAEATYVYRIVRAGAFVTPFASIPCATCPVARSCHEGNPISPQSCEYLAKWLAF